ncbi:MAG: epimerase [Bacteroidia bacterium]
MKIILTGASGLIGNQLCNQLKQKGFDVDFLKRHHYNNTTNQKDWSSRKNIFWSNPEILENADAVVHLAGANVANRWTKSIKAEIINSRREGTRALIDACSKCQNPPKHIISASGIGIYPEGTGQVMTEISEHGDGFLATVCKVWENEILNNTLLGTSVSCLRTGIVLSNRSKIIGITKLQFQFFGMVGTVGSPENRWSWIHINDLCSMYIALIEGKMSPGIYNAVAPNPCTQKDFALAYEKFAPLRNHNNTFPAPLFWRIPCKINQIIRSFGISMRPNLPAPLIKLAWGERSVIALTNQNVSAVKTIDTGFCYQYPTIESALENLHNNPNS